MFINCGGEEVYINNTLKYKEDLESKLTPYYDGGNWAFSSTGNFLDDSGDDVYIISNTSNLHNISTSDTKLFINARTAAISLTYYGLCLLNGNYNLTLYFAEIVFSQDKSYNSLGKRVFDVYVQGELKIKDFDIVKEAGGTGRAVLKKYTVNVQKNTLKIQLYWAGKGTTCIPKRGSYGPIISAISVEPMGSNTVRIWVPISNIGDIDRFYMAPEYATRGYLTPKADVYGFGVVALEIVSGISVYTELMSDVKGYCIIDEALMLKGGDLLKMVDKDLGSDYSSEEALTVLNVAVLCLEVSAIRPTMSQTCNMLEGKLNINDFRSSMRPPLDQPIDISLLWPDYKRNDTETGASTSTQSVFTDSFVTEDFITKDFITEVPTFSS
ncbi:putative protein kinase RLK-Pelle-DLSV family [Helianthus annuus]|nr:putative protein kinase RLK-Pelle-DLSV family [Helianthus annuus]KAJ0646991.1 putative protein kinase RLK-Pelle-DLSV family [Helianthus annuus]KAJ0650890.1 putative protein kinase RLK-Pelle-DLSV family [Helianthus annuus]